MKTRYGGAALKAYNYDIAEHGEDEGTGSKDPNSRYF